MIDLRIDLREVPIADVIDLIIISIENDPSIKWSEAIDSFRKHYIF